MKQFRRIRSFSYFAAIMAAMMLPACDKSDGKSPNEAAKTPHVSASQTRATVPKPKARKTAATTTPKNPAPLSTDMTPKELYIAYCGACHSVDLVESQRLGRDDWAWVMQDMVEEYGGTWIKPDEQKIIIDYLAENFGPQ